LSGELVGGVAADYVAEDAGYFGFVGGDK